MCLSILFNFSTFKHSIQLQHSILFNSRSGIPHLRRCTHMSKATQPIAMDMRISSIYCTRDDLLEQNRLLVLEVWPFSFTQNSTVLSPSSQNSCSVSLPRSFLRRKIGFLHCATNGRVQNYGKRFPTSHSLTTAFQKEGGMPLCDWPVS